MLARRIYHEALSGGHLQQSKGSVLAPIAGWKRQGREVRPGL
jgi:hypothetical protein